MKCYSMLTEALHSRYTADGILQHVLHLKNNKKKLCRPFSQAALILVLLTRDKVKG